jgi:hypothetical protein
MPKLLSLSLTLAFAATFASPALGSGDSILSSSTAMANRHQSPLSVLMQMLEFARTDREVMRAMAKYEKLRDPAGTSKPHHLKLEKGEAAALGEALKRALGDSSPVKVINPGPDDNNAAPPKE